MSFNPETLRHAPELGLRTSDFRHVCGNMMPGSFIPPVEDFGTTSNCDGDDGDDRNGNVDYSDNVEGGSNDRTGPICTSTQPSTSFSPK
jgi:hypothetical protein